MSASRRPNKTVIRSIPPGSPIPTGTPKRYYNAPGYVRLRWKMAPYTYLECFEHRVVDGMIVAGNVERHHINRVRDDNRPENLATLTPEEHDREHHHCDVLEDIVRLYREGHSTVAVGRMVDRDPAVVYRHLIAQGVPIRNRVRYLDDEERAYIRQLFAQGCSWAEVERITGRSTWSIARIRREQLSA